MRSKLNAYLQFGSIIVPVGVATAARAKDIKLRRLHADCGTPVSQKNNCSVCKQDLDADDIIKGFEFSKGKFIHLDEKEMGQFTVPRSNVIELRKFVPVDDVPLVGIAKTDYLIPHAMGPLRRPYEGISAALLKSSVFGIGKATLYGKEHPVAVGSQEGVLVLHTLYFAEEVNSPAEIAAQLTWDVPDQDVALLSKMMESYTEPLEADDLRNESRDREALYIEQKIAGKQVEMPEVEPEPVASIDYLASVREMIAANQKKKPTRRKVKA